MKPRSEWRQASAISQAFVETRRVRKAFQRIDELLEHGWEDSYCRGLLLLGHSRAGKTHIVNNYIRLRSQELPDNAERPRFLKVEVQAGCTLKILATDLLIALDDPDPEGGSQADKTRRVAEAIERAGLDMLVIDEVQRLIDGDTDKVKRDVANWITGLLNRRLCPLLLVGERKATRVLEDNMHLKGRTFGEEELTPHSWSDTEDRQEFRAILHVLDGMLDLPEKSGLGTNETALRIYCYAEGLLGQAATLVSHAAVVARRDGRPCLTHDILAQAVDELTVGEDKQSPNPFRTEVRNPSPASAPPTPHVPRRRTRRTDPAAEA